ncbi:MAG TPA: AraC family transcriptional regulator [Puia sp.]|jgi:AraC-like DNA-binding protein|nr:AraC family transcriptional regulator [Puia sp.]
MDALSGVLESAKLKTVVYPKLHFTLSTWGIEIERDSRSQFWRLLKGTCYLRVPGEKVIKMDVGDFVCIPHGSTHRISGKPNTTCVPASQFGKALRSGTPLFQGKDEETILMGGHFEFTPSVQHPFIKSLPKVIHINTTKELNLWLQQAAVLMNEEISAEKIGSKLILGRLVDILFVLIIRAYLEQVDLKGGFLMALKDNKISNSLKSMHECPEKDWTLNQLAATAGMSRSLYCREFKRLVGETPLSYLTNWRILKSKEILSESKENISEVASRVGYQSEAAFNRLFKTKVGVTPANYRRKSVV